MPHMSDTHQWAIQIAGGNVIGSILGDSIYETGPYNPAEVDVIIAQIHYQNSGDIAGNIYIKSVQYPNTPEEEEIDLFTAWTNPGQNPFITLLGDVPNTPGGVWPVGVKVWGESESEPSWGSYNAVVWG